MLLKCSRRTAMRRLNVIKRPVPAGLARTRRIPFAAAAAGTVIISCSPTGSPSVTQSLQQPIDETRAPVTEEMRIWDEENGPEGDPASDSRAGFRPNPPRQKTERLLESAVVQTPHNPAVRLIRAATVLEMLRLPANRANAYADFDVMAEWIADPASNPAYARILGSGEWRESFDAACEQVLAGEGEVPPAPTICRKLRTQGRGPGAERQNGPAHHSNQ